MADNSPDSGTPPASPGPGAGAPGSPPGAPPAPSSATPAPRPDWVPDQFWNAQKSDVDVQGMAAGFKDLASRFAKGKEALVPEVRAELTKELFGKRPEKPEGYTFQPPKDGPLADRLAKNNLVLLPQKPGAEFQPEKGKVYYVFDQNGPLFQLGRQLAHKAGMGNEEFAEMATSFVEIEAAKESARQQETTSRIAENRKLLGDAADKRIDYVKGKIKVLAGDKAPDALDIDYLPASAIEALETLLEKAGEPRFSSGSGAAAGAKDASALNAEVKALQESPDYWDSPAKQARASEIFKQLAPGPARAGNFKKKA